MKNKNKRILSKFFKTENNTSSTRIKKTDFILFHFIFFVSSHFVLCPLQFKWLNITFMFADESAPL